jgi:hypothetical protein
MALQPGDFTYHYSFHYQINSLPFGVYINLFVVWTLSLPYRFGSLASFGRSTPKVY